MADEPKIDPVTGNPVSEPVELGDDGLPVPKAASSHKHRWQGMRSGGKRIRMCSVCGKQEEKKEDEE